MTTLSPLVHKLTYDFSLNITNEFSEFLCKKDGLNLQETKM